MVRLLFLAFLVWAAYHLAKKMIKAYFTSLNSSPQSRGPDCDTELIRDPQCGAYFMKQKGVKAIVDGEVVYFCSEQCRQRYLQKRSAH